MISQSLNFDLINCARFSNVLFPSSKPTLYVFIPTMLILSKFERTKPASLTLINGLHCQPPKMEIDFSHLAFA